MGGRGGTSGKGGSKAKLPSGASLDGTIIGGEKKHIETMYRKQGSGSMFGYYKNEVLEAKTDGNGNLTFSYADPTFKEPSSKSAKMVGVSFDVQAGAVDGKTFGIDWSKVQSVQGQTYSVKSEAKANGLSWDSQKKIWARKK